MQRQYFQERSLNRVFTLQLTLSNPHHVSSEAEVVGEEHYEIARRVQEALQRYAELQDIISILGMEELDEEDKNDRIPCKKDPEVPVSAVPRS